MQGFIDNAKSSGKTITWGTSGAATMHATIGHVFFDAYGIPHKKVPFKGGSKARAALVSQSVDAVLGGVNTVVGFEEDIRPLASAGADRDPTAKDLATFGEQGLDGLDFTGLMCLFGPRVFLTKLSPTLAPPLSTLPASRVSRSIWVRTAWLRSTQTRLLQQGTGHHV